MPPTSPGGRKARPQSGSAAIASRIVNGEVVTGGNPLRASGAGGTRPDGCCLLGGGAGLGAAGAVSGRVGVVSGCSAPPFRRPARSAATSTCFGRARRSSPSVLRMRAFLV